MGDLGQSLLKSLGIQVSASAGQMFAVMLFVFIFANFFGIFYLVMKAISVRNRAEEVHPTLTPGATPSAISAANPEAAAAKAERDEFVRELGVAKRVLMKVYRVMMTAVVAALFLAAVYFYMIATAGNGLILVAILVAAVGFIMWGQMRRFLSDENEAENEIATLVSGAGAKDTGFNLSSVLKDGKFDFSSVLKDGTFKINKTVTVESPTVIRLQNNALQTARDLMRQGRDMDEVCRTIDPDYANWGSLRQQLFKKAMEEVLKAESPTQ